MGRRTVAGAQSRPWPGFEVLTLTRTILLISRREEAPTI